MTPAGGTKPTLSMHLVQLLDQMHRAELPASTVDKAKTCCLDFLAACWGAADSKSAAIGLDTALRMGRGFSTLIGRTEGGPPRAPRITTA